MISYEIIIKKKFDTTSLYWNDRKGKGKKEEISFLKIKELGVNEFIEKGQCFGERITMCFKDAQGFLVERYAKSFDDCDQIILFKLPLPSLIYYQGEDKMRLKEDVDIQIEEEKPAIELYGTNRSQHSPMEEEYSISYTTLKEMEIGEEITWGTENDGYEVKVIFTDEYGALVRITHYNNNPYMEEEPCVELKYFQWINN